MKYTILLSLIYLGLQSVKCVKVPVPFQQNNPKPKYDNPGQIRDRDRNLEKKAYTKFGFGLGMGTGKDPANAKYGLHRPSIMGEIWNSRFRQKFHPAWMDYCDPYHCNDYHKPACGLNRNQQKFKWFQEEPSHVETESCNKSDRDEDNNFMTSAKNPNNKAKNEAISFWSDDDVDDMEMDVSLQNVVQGFLQKDECIIKILENKVGSINQDQEQNYSNENKAAGQCFPENLPESQNCLENKEKGKGSCQNAMSDQSMDIFDCIGEDLACNRIQEKENFDCFLSTIMCLDILSSVLDKLPGIDCSSGSSDDYIPESCCESDNSSVRQKKKKLAGKSPIFIAESDTDATDNVGPVNQDQEQKYLNENQPKTQNCLENKEKEKESCQNALSDQPMDIFSCSGEDLACDRMQEKKHFDCFLSTIMCLDILSSVLDTLPGIDFSSGSSDDYIPESCCESDNSSVRQKKKKLARKRPIFIAESDTDATEDAVHIAEGTSREEDSRNGNPSKFWEREGMKNGKKRKLRKSEKERREDRDQRKILRNTGQEYLTKTRKLVQKRVQEVLEPCKRFRCSEKVPENFRQDVFGYYWQLGSYEKRREFVSCCIDMERKKSARLEIKGTRQREFANKYVLRYMDKQYSVCKACFLKILNETSKFLQVVRKYMEESSSRILEQSSRGRQPSYKAVSEEQLEQAKQHILSFPAYESHYGRSNTSKKFLPSHLNITIMYENYVNEISDPVSKTIYTSIFKAQGLSFKQPQIDTCLKCDTFHAQIRAAPDGEQSQLKDNLAIHQKAAQAVYDAKKFDKSIASDDTRKDLMVLTFDLQQCLPTPFLTTGAAFYKRQLWTYNLTIHDCVANTAICYMWHEAQGARGGNEIASCIYHFIMHKVPENIKHIILYSDSCAGQNKNKFIIVMFLLAIQNSHVESIEHKFMVPGHTHMECDTDHALIEKAKKKTNMKIHHPRDWYQLVRNVSKKITVQEMTQEEFLEFSSLLKGQNAFVARSMNTDKERFFISAVRIFKYTKELFPKFMYQDNDLNCKTVDYGRKRRQVPDYTIIPRSYSGPLPISKEKKADLLSLLPLIDTEARQFYIGLKSSDDVPNIDPDLENYEED